MEAIILAGGFGTRLSSLIKAIPKPMAPISGTPFLEILLVSLSEKGVDRVILSLGYKASEITSYFGERFLNLDLVYVIEDSPLGTGGAIRKSLSKCNEDHVYIFNGDTFLDFELDKLEESWEALKAPIMTVKKSKNTGRYGRIMINENNMIISYQEKNIDTDSGFINVGCYILPKNILDDFEINQPFSFENDFLNKEKYYSKFFVCIYDGFFIDIGIPADYKKAQKQLLKFKTNIQDI